MNEKSESTTDTKPPLPLVAELLRRVIDHMYHDERTDYESTPITEREGHIFLDVHALDCWLASIEERNEDNLPIEPECPREPRVHPAVTEHGSYSLGPYTRRRNKDGCDDCCDIIAADGSVVASIRFWDEPDMPDLAARAEANASLLAAAPDLLKAVVHLLDVSMNLPTSILSGEFYDAEYKARMIVTEVLGSRGRIL